MRQGQELLSEVISKSNRQKNISLLSRKALNSFYANYGVSSQKFVYKDSVEPLEIMSEFYNSVKSTTSIGEIYKHLLSAALKMGYSFTALATPDNEYPYLNIDAADFTTNVYTLKQPFRESENILVKTYTDGIRRLSGNTNFLKIKNIAEHCCIVIPLSCQNETRAVFVAGSYFRDYKNDEVLNNLCSYASLLISNQQLNNRLYSAGNLDNLTGLATHREFQENLSHQIKKAEQSGESISVILFDINNISRINREFGHAKGDEIICVLSKIIKRNIRSKDIAARYGGDEIAVILPDTDNTKSCYIAKLINNALAECYIAGIGLMKVSIGLSTYPKCANDQEKLLILAEQAMLISKHNGYKNGTFSVVSAQDIDFWNAVALDTLARVIAKRHSKWGINFEDELVKRLHKSKKTSKTPVEVVSSLACAIDAKDTYTRGHSQSVSAYSEALARSINLPEKVVERIKLAALLHDVGKIGIAEPILRKPGALTDHEWEIMKQHPVIGAKKVLEPIKSLKDLIPIVKHHHERIDGSGYPDRLKDDEIPLGAKIVSIADSFHALISHRPYRKALSLDRALEILSSGAGSQWDNELVAKFISIAPSLYTKP